MDFVICPTDGAHLKADVAMHVVGKPLVLRCPTCGHAFSLSDRGLRGLPDDRRNDN